MDKIPYIEPALLEYLDRYYPDKAPELSWSDREVWFRRGACDVVRTIKRLHEEQQDNILR